MSCDIHNFVCRDCYSFVAALGIEGCAAIHVVPGSLNGGEFFENVVDNLFTMNSFPGNQSIIIIENCWIYKSETLHELVESFSL
ncbi:hypothetical protein FB446DRAFT_650377 [Lentinula raphanica]|nr:hypothetical protein FB446DRAFT_650377 [Lentinula raphanica]